VRLPPSACPGVIFWCWTVVIFCTIQTPNNLPGRSAPSLRRVRWNRLRCRCAEARRGIPPRGARRATMRPPSAGTNPTGQKQRAPRRRGVSSTSTSAAASKAVEIVGNEALRNALILHRRYWRDFEPNPVKRQANDPQGFIALGSLAWATLATRSRPGRHPHVGLLTAERDRKSPGWQFRPGVARAKASLTRFELNNVIFFQSVSLDRPQRS
jgi:hypothetical protein